MAHVARQSLSCFSPWKLCVFQTGGEVTRTCVSKSFWNKCLKSVLSLLENQHQQWRLCIEMTFMNNGWWVNYYEKCYDLWHICLSINQPTLIYFNNNFNFSRTGLCRRTGRFLVNFLKRKWRFLDIEEILMEFTFNFYPSNPKPMYPSLHISWKRKLQQTAHFLDASNGSQSWTTIFR